MCEEEAAPQAHGEEGGGLRKIAVLVCMHSIVWDLVSSPQDWKRDPLLCRCGLREGSVPSCIFQCHPKDSGEDTPSSIPFKVPVAAPASRLAFDATGKEWEVPGRSPGARPVAEAWMHLGRLSWLAPWLVGCSARAQPLRKKRRGPKGQGKCAYQ